MSKTRFAPASILALGLFAALPACGTSTGPNDQSELIPYRTDWQEVARWPFDNSAVGTINIGGALDGDNFANRGNVEVYYIDTQEIVVQMRKFTFASTEAEAQIDYDKMSAWMNTGSKVIPEELDPLATCLFTDPEDGSQYWADSCGIHLYYDGQAQKLRAGADIRVFLPNTWEGKINVVTEDNVEELEAYPDRGDVIILDLPGSAEVRVDSGKVDIRLAANVEPVPACNEAQNQACEDVGWDSMDPDCSVCTEFGRVRVIPGGPFPVQATLDAPSDLWINATVKNTEVGLTSQSECEATINCEEFGGCNWIDNDPNKPFNRRAELNKPSNSLEGLGYNVNMESAACATIDVANNPDDFEAPSPELRGELLVCSGCLSGLSAP